MPHVQELRIDGIADNSVVARAPNSIKPASVRLRALGAIGEVQWLVNGRLEWTTQGAQSFEHQFKESGDQAITAMTDSGAWDRVDVRVLR
jgi:penicillin-binding protein 1C